MIYKPNITNIMRKTILLLAMTLFATGQRAADDLTLKSPDGTIGISISMGDKMTYSMSVDGNKVLTGCELGMTISGKKLGIRPKLKNVRRTSVNETITREVPIKNAQVRNHYNNMTLNMSAITPWSSGSSTTEWHIASLQKRKALPM